MNQCSWPDDGNPECSRKAYVDWKRCIRLEICRSTSIIDFVFYLGPCLIDPDEVSILPLASNAMPFLACLKLHMIIMIYHSRMFMSFEMSSSIIHHDYSHLLQLLPYDFNGFSHDAGRHS